MNKIDKYSVIMSIYYKVAPIDLEMSINSILNQTYATNEFILIKDGKLTKEQENVLDKFIRNNKKIFKIYQFDENKGAGVAYNKGIEMCTNKWAAIMDSDDFARKDKFEKQMDYLYKHKDIDVISSNAIEFIDNIENVISTRIMPENNEEIIKFAHARCPIIQPTAIFRVESVLKAGSYQHSPLTEDYDLYIRMIINGCKFYTYQEILYYIRTSESFFKRRGGIKYLKPILSFKWRYFRKGFFTFKQFLKTFIASFFVASIPNFLRKYIYKKFLRD